MIMATAVEGALFAPFAPLLLVLVLLLLVVVADPAVVELPLPSNVLCLATRATGAVVPDD